MSIWERKPGTDICDCCGIDRLGLTGQGKARQGMTLFDRIWRLFTAPAKVRAPARRPPKPPKPPRKPPQTVMSSFQAIAFQAGAFQ